MQKRNHISIQLARRALDDAGYRQMFVGSAGHEVWKLPKGKGDQQKRYGIVRENRGLGFTRFHITPYSVRETV